jgi:glucose-fructose oxidoreductase
VPTNHHPVRRSSRSAPARRRIRYAVVGAGHIAQNAVLPAFVNAKKNSELTAIISDDPKKRAKLKRLYGVENFWSYDQYDEACGSGLFDAVYIALPNSMHRDYTCRAAAAGIHVLCEKPMAVNAEECQTMIDAAQEAGVKLMIAYRLHFEACNLQAVQIAGSGKLGKLRLFNSVFSMQVKDDNIRLEAELGGGALFDIGIYCINAARYIFGGNPTEVSALMAQGDDPRFSEVGEAISAVMRFPGDRLASFTCSFGAADASIYEVLGAKGSLRVEPAYNYQEDLGHKLKIGDKVREKKFKKRDQFAPELLYFSDCVINNREPEPGGAEGLIDVRIIEAIYESVRTGQPVPLDGLPTDPMPSLRQEIRRPAPRKKPLVHAESAHT